jgi:hypothetical protein
MELIKIKIIRNDEHFGQCVATELVIRFDMLSSVIEKMTELAFLLGDDYQVVISSFSAED